jgi:hypothetical protein
MATQTEGGGDGGVPATRRTSRYGSAATSARSRRARRTMRKRNGHFEAETDAAGLATVTYDANRY